MKIVFLHIPKTAGQSVLDFLTKCTSEEAVCPARENFQLVGRPISELRSYQVFAGHFDWAAMDCVSQAAFVFTILREPLERILSFYFFLRRAAAQVPLGELQLPHNRGLSAAYHDSPDQFFCGGDPEIREFHDNIFDNFYMNYFAGRSFTARRQIQDVLQRPDTKLTVNDILDCALDNLNQLTSVYRISDLDLLQQDLALRNLKPRVPTSLQETMVNVSGDSVAKRMAQLKELGATNLTFDAIQRMTEFDSKIWSLDAVFRPRN
jgi:hypothetical protein